MRLGVKSKLEDIADVSSDDLGRECQRYLADIDADDVGKGCDKQSGINGKNSHHVLLLMVLN